MTWITHLTHAYGGQLSPCILATLQRLEYVLLSKQKVKLIFTQDSGYHNRGKEVHNESYTIVKQK